VTEVAPSSRHDSPKPQEVYKMNSRENNTNNRAGASPSMKRVVSCEILVRETFVSAVEQIDIASDLLDAALNLCDLSGGDLSECGGRHGNQLTHQVLVLIETSKKMIAPVRTALAQGELGEIGGAA